MSSSYSGGFNNSLKDLLIYSAYSVSKGLPRNVSNVFKMEGVQVKKILLSSFFKNFLKLSFYGYFWKSILSIWIMESSVALYLRILQYVNIRGIDFNCLSDMTFVIRMPFLLYYPVGASNFPASALLIRFLSYLEWVENTLYAFRIVTQILLGYPGRYQPRTRVPALMARLFKIRSLFLISHSASRLINCFASLISRRRMYVTFNRTSLSTPILILALDDKRKVLDLFVFDILSNLKGSYATEFNNHTPIMTSSLLVFGFLRTFIVKFFLDITEGGSGVENVFNAPLFSQPIYEDDLVLTEVAKEARSIPFLTKKKSFADFVSMKIRLLFSP